MNLSCVIFKVNIINNPEQWWVDIDATRYACIKKMFSNYKEVDIENLYKVNLSTSKVLGIEKVILKINFEKFLTVNNVLYDADIKKNLMFISLLSKNNFKMVFQSDKFK